VSLDDRLANGQSHAEAIILGSEELLERLIS
jgi:hypothetical protein